MQDDKGDPIFGGDTPVDICDELMFALHLAKLRLQPGCLPSFANYKKFITAGQLETELFRRKWFDYRFLHPVVATYVYAHYFTRIYRQLFAKHVSRRDSEYIRVFKDEDLFQCDTAIISGVWRARQVADAIGAPYPFVIEAGFRLRLNYWKQKYMPRVNHIYADWIIEKTIDEWEETLNYAAPHGDHAQYRLQNYIGTRDQDDHHAHLLNLAGRRPNPVPLLSTFVDNELLSLEAINARFDDDVVNQVKEAA